MGDYQALVAYLGVVFVVFIGGVFWMRYRLGIKRKLNLKLYNEEPPDPEDQKQDHVDHVRAASR